MTERIRWNYDYYEEQEELEHEQEELEHKHNENVNLINEMKDKTSYFVSGVTSDGSGNDDKPHHFNDEGDGDDIKHAFRAKSMFNNDDDDDYDELNRLKQRYKDKEKKTVTDDLNVRDALYGHTDNDVLQEEQLYDSNLGQDFNVPMDSDEQQHQQEKEVMDFLPDEKKNSDIINDKMRRNSLYENNENDANSANELPERASQEEKDNLVYKSLTPSIHSLSQAQEPIDNDNSVATDNKSLTECMNVKSLTNHFLSDKKESSKQSSDKTLKSETSSKGFIGWGDHNDKMDDSVITNDNISGAGIDNSKNTYDSRSSMMLMNKISKSATSANIVENINPDDDVYEGFVSRDDIIEHNFNNLAALHINQDEEYDAKRPWRKGPSLTMNDNDNNNNDIDNSLTKLKLKSNEQLSTSSNILQDASYDKKTESTVMADDFIDLESQCGLNSIDGSEIHLAQDGLARYENMNHNSKIFFEQPHFHEIVNNENSHQENQSNKDEEKKDGDEGGDSDVRWLKQLQPASTSNLSGKESGYYLSSAIAKTKFGAKLMDSKNRNLNDSDDNSMSSMVRNAEGNGKGGSGGWGKLRMFLQQDESSTKPKMTSDRKKTISAALIAAAKKMKEEEAEKEAKTPMRDVYDSDDTSSQSSSNNNDKNKSKKDYTNSFNSTLDPNLAPSYSEQQIQQSGSTYSVTNNDEYGHGDNNKNNNNPNKKSSSIKEMFLKHKNIIAITFTLLLIGGIIGIVIILTTGDKEEEGSKQPKPTPELDVTWNPIFTGQNATGGASMSDDGNVVAYVTKDEKLFFYYVNTKLNQESEYSAPPISAVEIPGTDECLVRVTLKNPESAINVKNNDNGVWTSRTDVATKISMESASVSKGCNKIIVGVPSDNNYGEDAGVALIYDVKPGVLDLTGALYGPKKAGCRTGEAVSISNTGTVAAVGSPFADINGPNSGQVTIRELDINNKWNLTHTIEGEEGEELGSSLYVSHDGTRIAIGSPKYSFGNIQKGGKIQVLHKNKTSKKWEPLGDSIMGNKYEAYMGRVITMSGDGNRLFTNLQKQYVRVYQWGDTINNDVQNFSPTTWYAAGRINNGMDKEVVDVTASMHGNRTTVGYKDDTVVVFENVKNDEEETE